MRKYEIATPYGERYFIHERGEIERGDGLNRPNDQWRLVSIFTVRGRFVVSFDDLDEWLASSPDLLYKNGKPRYTVHDFDHGGYRTWGNTDYHGIKTIAKVRDE